MYFTNWYPVSARYINSYLEELRDIDEEFVQLGDEKIIISVASDSYELLRFCSKYLPKPNFHHDPDIKLYYLLNTAKPFHNNRGFSCLRRYSKNNLYNDSAIDVVEKIVLFAGVRHFGLLKSIISGLHSLYMADKQRQGIHSAAFTWNERGILLAGGAESGKTMLSLDLFRDAAAIVTDDWCDIVIEPDQTVRAIGVERNISFNINDVSELINNGYLMPEISLLEPIPHGHRDKIIVKLDDLYPEKTVSETKIQKIIILTDVRKPKIVNEPTAQWLYETLS